jgi:chromosomal replication initiation ATPase DnaA
MNIQPIRDDCKTAAEVFAKAKIVIDRRRRMLRIATVVDPDVAEKAEKQPERFFMWPVAVEIARQLAIDAHRLKGSETGRKMPIIQYRQLAMTLALRLTGNSLPQVGRAFDADHTTVLHAKRRMWPIIEAAEMTLDNSLSQWVAACLPLLFAFLEQLRVESRKHSALCFSKKTER